MFQYKWTPLLAVGYAVIIGTAVVYFVETPDRPLTVLQMAVFYLLSYLPGLGLSMLSDPEPQRLKQEYLKIDFYAPKETAGMDGPAGPPLGCASPMDASMKGGTR